MDHMTCIICRTNIAQELGRDDDWYSGVCADCGPYKIDKQVMKIMQQGRRLNAGMMKKWIAREYDRDTNPHPAITIYTAVWAD